MTEYLRPTGSDGFCNHRDCTKWQTCPKRLSDRIKDIAADTQKPVALLGKRPDCHTNEAGQ